MSHKIKLKVMTWNVRGLNDRRKRLAVRQAILIERPDLITLQETKLHQIDRAIFREICGRRIDQYVFLPALGTRGGILIAWKHSTHTLLSHTLGQYTLTVSLQRNTDLSEWDFTAVYGPTADQHRGQFYQ